MNNQNKPQNMFSSQYSSQYSNQHTNKIYPSLDNYSTSRIQNHASNNPLNTQNGNMIQYYINEIENVNKKNRQLCKDYNIVLQQNDKYRDKLDRLQKQLNIQKRKNEDFDQKLKLLLKNKEQEYKKYLQEQKVKIKDLIVNQFKNNMKKLDIQIEGLKRKINQKQTGNNQKTKIFQVDSEFINKRNKEGFIFNQLGLQDLKRKMEFQLGKSIQQVQKYKNLVIQIHEKLQIFIRKLAEKDQTGLSKSRKKKTNNIVYWNDNQKLRKVCKQEMSEIQGLIEGLTTNKNSNKIQKIKQNEVVLKKFLYQNYENLIQAHKRIMQNVQELKNKKVIPDINTLELQTTQYNNSDGSEINLDKRAEEIKAQIQKLKKIYSQC